MTTDQVMERAKQRTERDRQRHTGSAHAAEMIARLMGR